jgi:hypothetical protein
MSVTEFIEWVPYKPDQGITNGEKQAIDTEVKSVREQKEGWQDTQYALWLEVYGDVMRDMCNAGIDDIRYYYLEYRMMGLKAFHVEYRNIAKVTMTPDEFDRLFHLVDLKALIKFSPENEQPVRNVE